MEALERVQEQLAQGRTLDEAAPELDSLNQMGQQLQPVERGYSLSTAGPSMAGQQGESSRQGESRRPSPERPSPRPRPAPKRSPPARKRSPSTESEPDVEPTPRGTKRRMERPQTPGPQVKVPRVEVGQVRPPPSAPALDEGKAPAVEPTVATPVATVSSPNVTLTLGSTAAPSPTVSLRPTAVPAVGTAARPIDLEPSMRSVVPVDQSAPSTLRADPETVDLAQYDWMLAPARGHHGRSNLEEGIEAHRSAFDSFQRTWELETFRRTSTLGYLHAMARYLGVPPAQLNEEIRTLKQQNDQYRREAEHGVQARALQKEMEAMEERNNSMERTIESMEGVLREHTKRWATARNMLETLEGLASPQLFAGGQAFLRGLQTSDNPQMAQLLLALLAHLPEELGKKILEIRQVVAKVKASYGVVVPAYRWDEDSRTFEPALSDVYPATGKCMSQVPQYQLSVNPEQLVIGQLPEIPDWAGVKPEGSPHNSPGPDSNHSGD